MLNELFSPDEIATRVHFSILVHRVKASRITTETQFTRWKWRISKIVCVSLDLQRVADTVLEYDYRASRQSSDVQ